jgi:hypothetical protein
MDVQNISGPDVVQSTVQTGNTSQQNENIQQQNNVQVVNEENVGSNYDSYA